MARVRATTPSSARRQWLWRLAASVAILSGLFAVVPLRQTWHALRGVSGELWGIVLVGYLAVHLLGATKYWLVLNVAGAGLRWPVAVRCYAGGLFGTLFLPSLVGGDLVRAGMALRSARSRMGVLVGSLLDRLIDVVALTVLAGAGAALVRVAAGSSPVRVSSLPTAAATWTGLGLLSLLGHRSFRLRRRLVHLRRAGRACVQGWPRLLAGLMLALSAQSGFLLLAKVLADECGLRLSLQVWLFVWPLAKLSALVPLTQGGVGVREAALAALLVPFGVPASAAVAAGLAWETIVLAGALTAGAVAVLLAHWLPEPAISVVRDRSAPTIFG